MTCLGQALVVQPTPIRSKSVVKDLVRLFMREESGQDLIEYALIAALIALAAVGAMQSVGSNISNVFNSIGSNI